MCVSDLDKAGPSFRQGRSPERSTYRLSQNVSLKKSLRQTHQSTNQQPNDIHTAPLSIALVFTRSTSRSECRGSPRSARGRTASPWAPTPNERSDLPFPYLLVPRPFQMSDSDHRDFKRRSLTFHNTSHRPKPDTHRLNHSQNTNGILRESGLSKGRCWARAKTERRWKATARTCLAYFLKRNTLCLRDAFEEKKHAPLSLSLSRNARGTRAPRPGARPRSAGTSCRPARHPA